MKLAGKTDVGRVRRENQDDFRAGELPGGAAWGLVCDGMGGARGGREASRGACDVIERCFQEQYGRCAPGGEEQFLTQALENANHYIFQKSARDEALAGMGTTVVLLVAAKGTLHVAHVGDSRAYLRHGGVLTQITMDHSYVQDLVNFGQITQEEARVHPKRNIITRVLGVHEEVRCDYAAWDFSPGDLALACSDGLSNYMDEDLLDQYMEEYGDAGRTLPRELIQYAVQCGGSDNITAAVIFNG